MSNQKLLRTKILKIRICKTFCMMKKIEIIFQLIELIEINANTFEYFKIFSQFVVYILSQ